MEKTRTYDKLLLEDLRCQRWYLIHQTGESNLRSDILKSYSEKIYDLETKLGIEHQSLNDYKPPVGGISQ